VHDCFLVDFLNISEFIDVLNACMNEKLIVDDLLQKLDSELRLYSIFIII
jgi:hypothetical protein